MSDIITPAQYERDVIRTTLVGATYTEDMNLVAEALAGEAAELAETLIDPNSDRARIMDEAGDMLYYIVMGACRLLGIRFARFLKLAADMPASGQGVYSEGVIRLLIATGKLCETVKKITYHKHPTDKAKLTDHLLDIFARLAIIIAAEGIAWQDVMAANIKKRALRYPHGFSTSASLRRADVPVVDKPARIGDTRRVR